MERYENILVANHTKINYSRPLIDNTNVLFTMDSLSLSKLSFPYLKGVSSFAKPNAQEIANLLKATIKGRMIRNKKYIYMIWTRL